MKIVKVNIYSQQVYSDHKEENNNSYKGKVTSKGEQLFITYKETETGVMTAIKVMDQKVQVKRIGQLGGELRFEEGSGCKTLYATPYGNFPIEIQTHRCQVEQLEEKMQIIIEYTMFMDGEKVSDHTLKVLTH